MTITGENSYTIKIETHAMRLYIYMYKVTGFFC